jgi:hypothetical protein
VGWVKGEWTRFVLGHNRKTTPRYAIDAETGCWNTLGGTTALGYGKIMEKHRTHLLHRWMYERMLGPIPAGKHLHHLCGNKGCCNPTHLTPVTLKEHRAMDSAKLTDADVREIILLGASKAITRAEIARRFSISTGHVKNILSGHRRAD